MPRVATCPKCGQPVTIGDGLTDSTDLRCPLCEAEFVLSSATGLATDLTPEDDVPNGDPPPEVIPVTAEGEDRGEPATEEALVRARCPSCGAEFGLDRILLTTTGEPLGREAVAAITAKGQVKELPDFAGTATREEAPRIDIDMGDPTGPAISDGAFDFIANGDDNADAASASTAAFGRRRPKEKSMMREFTGIMLGGVAGLAIAYYGLNFIGGPRFDFLEIYLPGIEHTSGHRPSWLPRATAIDADLGESELAD